MRQVLIIVFSLALLIASAKADSIMLFFGVGSSGGGSGGGGCTGTIDLSTGCVQPMFKGL